MAKVARLDRRLPERQYVCVQQSKVWQKKTKLYVYVYAYFVFDTTCATFSFTIPGTENHSHGMFPMDTSNEK